MAMTNRIPTLVLAVVAFALTVTGVVLAATDSNPGSIPKDNLTLNGYPPHSAQLFVTVSTGQAYSLTSNVNVDFTNSRVEAFVHFPLVFAVASVDLRLVDDHLFAGSAEATSGAFLSTPMKQPSLFGLALEMTKPDIALIKGFDETVVRSGDTTTYEFRRSGVAVSNVLGGSNTQASVGTMDWSITVGSQGEVTRSSLVVHDARSTTSISVVVLSYNKPVDVVAPPAGQVRSVEPSTLRNLLGSVPLSTLLLPQNLTSLGQLHLN